MFLAYKTNNFIQIPCVSSYNSFKLVIGVAIPVKLGLKQSMVYALNFQYQYVAAQNRSQLEVYPPIISRSRDKRQIEKSDRALVYLGLESLMNRYGINGKSCILRSICENAMESLHHEANGLYGHLMHIILTPDYGDGEIDEDLDADYLDAQKAGEYGVDCLSLFPACPYGHGILDLISLLEFQTN
ncbi:hypothetical protein ILUMI_24825 [Ignelater luminosus]|uniref:Uncharacterized protein n=1 Tax=Ignelater luminosus TaxID=2038154 RepID=A0A8K0C9I6_IGNLU|nr:hypothetical protein ILUMI_24825 [Ignelater luminosus]